MLGLTALLTSCSLFDVDPKIKFAFGSSATKVVELAVGTGTVSTFTATDSAQFFYTSDTDEYTTLTAGTYDIMYRNQIGSVWQSWTVPSGDSSYSFQKNKYYTITYVNDTTVEVTVD